MSVPVVGASRLDAADDGLRQRAHSPAEGSTLFVVAGADPNTDKPGTVFRFDPSAVRRGRRGPAWPTRTRVAANQLIRPIAVAAESGRLAITTSGNGLVVYD